MFSVIFSAEINDIDGEYLATAERLRALALEEYGCTDFISCFEDGREIAISYWETTEQISAWKNNPEHLAAQRLGQKKWYRSYRVQIAELTREYSSDT